MSIIGPDGSIIEYNSTHVGELFIGSGLKFTFFNDQIYFAKNYVGLFKLESNQPHLVSSLSSSYYVIKNNNDTIFLTIPFEPFLKFHNFQNYNITNYAENIFSQNNWFYKAGYIDGNLVKITGSRLNDFVDYYGNDSEYLSYFFNEAKFSRNTDTLYVACKQGVSFAYNYDFLDTITPFNTINMPSANVLEMEFDLQDRMWAVFGDTNDMPFAIALLENDTWVNYYDASNSPIQFKNDLGQKTFWGLEIDTLGNVWVCDSKALHTLLNENTPAWIGLNELEHESFDVYPNPVEDAFEIHFNSYNSSKEIKLLDLNAQVVLELNSTKSEEKISLDNLTSGIYILSVHEKNKIGYKKIVKK